MIKTAKKLREKYDGSGPNFRFSEEVLTPNAIYLVCEYDFHTHYDDCAIMTQEFNSIREAIAYIGYSLMTSDLSHGQEEIYTIGDSEKFNYFFGDSDYWESREDFEDMNIDSNESEIKAWIEKIDQLLEQKSNDQITDLDELIKDFNNQSGFFKVRARGDLQTYFTCNYFTEQLESFASSYYKGGGEKDADHPILVLRTLLKQDCFDAQNAKHEKIAIEVFKHFDD